MLNWSISFFIIAIVAAFLGFGGIAGTATEIAKILFFCIFSFVCDFHRRGPQITTGGLKGPGD